MQDMTSIPERMDIPCSKKAIHILKEQYVLQECLGKGAMGDVYLALDNYLQRKVAIKATPKSISSLAKDAIAARILHKNIVTLHHYFEENGISYLVMEYVQGQNLFQIVKENGPISWEKARDILLQTIHALAYLHEQGIVHGDIKPGNILIAQDGTVKLCDFGLSHPDKDGISLGGTPLYRAKGIHGKASDIYAWGLTCYFILTGKSPQIPLDWGQVPRSVPQEVILFLQNAIHNPPKEAAILYRGLQRMQKQSFWKRIIPLLFCLFWAFILTTDTIKRWDYACIVRYCARPKNPCPIVLIDIESPKIEENKIHQLCQVLAILVQSRAKCIGFDIFFSDFGPFSIQNQANQNLSSLLHHSSSQVALLSRLIPKKETYILEKPSPLYQSLPTGFGNLQNTYGIIQKLPLYYDIGGGELELSFALRFVLQSMGKDFLRISGDQLHFTEPYQELALEEQGLWLTYPALDRRWKILTLTQALSLSPEDCQNFFSTNLVFIGLLHSQEAADNHATPLGFVKGMAIQASTVQQILSRHIWKPWPIWQSFLSVALLSFFIIFVSKKYFLATLILVLLGYTISLFITLFFFSSWLSVPPVFTLGIAMIPGFFFARKI